MQAALAALRPANPRHPFPERDPDRPKGLNVLGTLAHHPAMTTAFHTLTGHVLFGTTLTPRQRELLVLRVAAVRDCEYEWAQHLVLAADAGISDDEVAQVEEGPTAGWSDLEGALLAAVDELLRDAKVADGTWAVLAAELDHQQLLDVIATVGTYDALAMVLRSAEAQLDDDLVRRKRPSH
jgi:AhpD family alkylhydroperoxidase